MFRSMPRIKKHRDAVAREVDTNDLGEPRKPRSHHEPLAFKFELELFKESDSFFGHEATLSRPQIPLLPRVLETSGSIDIEPGDSDNSSINHNKNAGRALAEWADSVKESDAFFQKRRSEGVPSYQEVETPTLDIDQFRRP